MTKTYTATQIKAQEKKYKASQNRYIKGTEKTPSTQATKKRAVELHYKAADEYEKLQEMKANKKRR